MKHQLHLCRDGDIIVTRKSLDFRAAFIAGDEMAHQVHTGIHGIGQFEIFVYEEAPEGHLEKCIFTSGLISVPARKTETAA
jgi:hypothetical protein